MLVAQPAANGGSNILLFDVDKNGTLTGHWETLGHNLRGKIVSIDFDHDAK